MIENGSSRFEGFSTNSLDYEDGERLPSGIYFYVIESENKLNKTGFIYLLNE